ncbi:MAG: DNA primase [Treponema sp.]
MVKIATETIDAVNMHTDLVSLVENYTHLEKRGYDWWGCCPFHNEKTASFHVVPDKKMYYCFGCGAGGSTVKFIMEMEKLSFTEAVEYLAKRAGIPVVYEQGVYTPQKEDTIKEAMLELYDRVTGTFQYFLKETADGKKALQYLYARGVNEEMFTQFRLGYAPKDRRWLYRFLRQKGYSTEFLAQSGLFSKKNPQGAFFFDRIMYPIMNRHGQVIAFGGRIIEGDGPKYLNTGDLPQYKKGATLFAFSQALPAIRKEKTVLFCEGYMDVIAFHQAGIGNAVAPLGTALTEEQVKLIRSFADTAILAFDSDAAGQSAAYKAILLCKKQRLQVRVFIPAAEKDPAEILLKKGKDYLTQCVKNAILDIDYLIKIALNRFKTVSPEGKAQAAAFLFPFIEVLESDIQKESSLNKFSADVGISSKALFTDYFQYSRTKEPLAYIQKSSSEDRGMIKMTAELRVVLAAVANPHLFQRMRTRLTSDDFEDSYAKDLFIVLEECYRADANTYDSLLSHCSSDVLRNMVSSVIITGEFSENAEQLVHDGIYYIKQSALQRQKDIILRKLQILHGGHSIDEIDQIHALLGEKLHIDKMLAELKETT